MVLNENRDIFVAVENAIRMCTINSKSMGYKVLINTYQPFDIVELTMNPQRTFLCSIGKKRVVVQSVPLHIDKCQNFHIPTEKYDLKEISAPIVKVLWHSYIAHGLGLVILEATNVIKFYNLRVSDAPLFTLDLKTSECFKNEIATSISFGSLETLTGGLTLYITTESSKIFEISPFVFANSSISTTEREVELALAESIDTLNFITANCDDDDYITRQARLQFNFFNHLQSELCRSNVSGVKTYLNKESFTYDIKPPSWSLNYKRIQGPLANLQMGTIKDICCLKSNGSIPLLVAINGDKVDLTVKYLAQIRPLVMNFTSADEYLSLEDAKPESVSFDSKPNVSLIIANTVDSINEPEKQTYKVPKIGFGYIDDDGSDDDCDSNGTNTIAKQTLNKPELFFINEVLIEIISDCSLSSKRKIILSSVDPHRFLISTEHKTVVSTLSDWVGILPDTPGIEIQNHYSVVENDDASSGVTLIRDDISFTGDYLINFHDKGKKDVNVVKVSSPPELNPLIYKFDTLKLKNEEKEQVVVDSKLNSNLLVEIESDLKKVKKISEIKYRVGSSDESVEILQKVNEFSTESLSIISIYESLLMKLCLQMKTNLLELQYQNELVGNISNIDAKKEHSAKIKKLIEKEDALINKSKSLHQKLVKRIEAIKVHRQVPLSENEKKWFQEINDINEKVGNSGTESGLYSSVTELKNQVNYIKEHLDFKPLQDMKVENSRELNRVKALVDSQGNTLTSLKDKVSELMAEGAMIQA
ncbi:hypothetical protein CANTEDRAFT_94013 [Yamadazyma tenuis ATCC 10573]|nr:uncharacterized protein CANTEDRAFT_94013 [Yamadazyma tenuis ATCC 10573]EGV63246.1 hypothetical protein CANTEDRAFT_94013 [Yamadazyma tenuis ATCC 10573]